MDIFDYIRSTGRDPSEIVLIILTHSHPDHIGAARAIKQLTGCSIAAHPAERASAYRQLITSRKFIQPFCPPQQTVLMT
jgi:glyoxylase-like metal-dependent hydrolase (beta-lactamase superfamily II)